MIRVLVVEDDRQIQRSWERTLLDMTDEVELIQAFSVLGAQEQYEDHPDVSIIVMDGCVPGDSLNTLSLVHELRKTFFGPIVAVSGVPQYRARLMEAGCDYECEKGKLPDKILEIIQELGF